MAAWSLAPGAVVSVVADGVALGTLTASPDGTAHLVLSSSPTAGQLPLPPEAQPLSNLLHVELLAGDGAVLAAGNFAAAPGI